MIDHRNALWIHAEMLAARIELAALRAAMLKLERAAMDPRVPLARSRECRGARNLIGERVAELRAEIERAEAAWH
jgi:hypothetical protein